jgi:hypothetical protein
MRFIKSWQFVITISVIIAFSFLFSVLYQDASAFPKDNWSRAIELDRIENVEDTEAFYLSYIDVKADDQFIYVGQIVNGVFKVTFYDALFNPVQIYKHTLSIDMSTPVEQMTMSKTDDGFDLLIAVNHILYQKSFNNDLSETIEDNIITDHYDQIVLKNNYAVYQIGNDFYNFNGQLQNFMFSREDVECFDFDVNPLNQKLYTAVMTYKDGKYYANAAIYDFVSNQLIESELKALKSPSATVPLEIEAYYADASFYTIFSLKNTKYGQNTNNVIILSSENLQPTAETEFSNSSYTPKFQFDNFNNQTVLTFSDLSFIGKSDVGSQKKTYSNILITPTFGMTTTPMTNTQYFSPNKVMLNFEDYQYLVTNECSNATNILYVNSNNPTLIEKSKHLKLNQFAEIAINCLTYIPASLMALFVPLIVLVFPVVVIILPIAIFKMSWAEKNQKKMLWIAISVYMLSKIYYFYSNQGDLMITNTGLGAEPYHMANFFDLILFGAFTSLISIGCLTFYTQRKINPYFINQFAFFYAMELIQILLYFIVYTVMYI